MRELDSLDEIHSDVLIVPYEAFQFSYGMLQDQENMSSILPYIDNTF